jgi:hypothetical protein
MYLQEKDETTYIAENFVSSIKSLSIKFKRFVTRKDSQNKELLNRFASFNGYLEDLTEDLTQIDEPAEYNKFIVRARATETAMLKNVEILNGELETNKALVDIKRKEIKELVSAMIRFSVELRSLIAQATKLYYVKKQEK